MKLKISTATLLLAGLTGASMSYAADPLTGAFQKDSQAVPVTIEGLITNTAVVGCSVATTGGLEFDMGNDEGDIEWSDASLDRYTLARVSGGSIEITCDAGTETDITFKTNNDFSEATYSQGTQYSSWPVVIVPDVASQETGDEGNLAESNINGYLGGVTCDQGTCDRSGSNLNTAKISSVNSALLSVTQTITAEIEGQLFATAPTYGNVQSSPRAGTAELYVIYEGKSSSQLPDFPAAPAGS